jgi:addiction module HigA family antidote
MDHVPHSNPQSRKIMKTIHPGVYLASTYVTPLGLSAGELAALLDVSEATIQRVLYHEGSLSANLAVRLEILFDKPAEEWLKLQMLFDISGVREQPAPERVKRYPKMNRLWVPGFPSKAGHYLWRQADGEQAYRVELLFDAYGELVGKAVLCYETTQFEIADYERGQWRCT